MPSWLLLQEAAQDVGQWPGRLAGWEVPITTLARALFVLVVTLYLASRIRHWFERLTARSMADANTRLVVARLLAILILVIGAATILDTFGIPLSAIVTFVGVVGLAISLSLQDILKNFFAGLYLLFERPFRIGDLVAVKDQRGTVETIGIRTTTLRTEENVLVMIPNSVLFVEIVANRTNFTPKPPDGEATAASAGQPAATPAAEPPSRQSG